MNETFEHPGRRRRGTLLAVLLALLSSVGSIVVAGAGGWQRGGAMLTDQELFAGMNVLAALAAQFLPALAARLASVKRVACVGIWLVCIAATALAHAWYLLAAQERAGTARAEALRLTQASPAPAGRERLAILNDRADIGDQLARLPVRACDGACADRQRFRKAALEDRLAALDAEAQAAADARQSRLQREERQRKAKEDLVGNRLAGSLGLSYSTVTWGMAMAYAIILEGVGCLCWTVVLRAEVTTPRIALKTDGALSETLPALPALAVTPADFESDDREPGDDAESRRTVGDSSGSQSPRRRDVKEDVARVTAAAHDSAIQLTVKQVRLLLNCSQKHAQAVRKIVAESPGRQPEVST